MEIYSFSGITRKIINFLASKTYKRAQEDHRFHLFCKKHNLPFQLQKNDSFDNLYLHSLIQFGLETEYPHLTYLFALGEVVDGFRGQLFKEDKEILLIRLNDHLHTNPDLRELKPHFPSLNSIQPYLETFTELFEQRTHESMTPSALKMYNMLQRVVESDYKNTFEYQIEEHLTLFKNKFWQEYLENDHYIPVYGENRKYGFGHSIERIIDEVSGRLEIDRNNLIRRLRGMGHKIPGETRRFSGEVEATTITEYTAFKYEPIDSYVQDWLQDEEYQLLLIVGEYGTGKTTFTRYLTQNLAKQYLGDKKDEGLKCPYNRIPLFLPLREFEGSIESFIQSQLSKKNLQLSYDQFISRLKAGEFLLVLDGFDEMTQEIDSHKKRQNYQLIKKLIDESNQVKAVLTVREEYFLSVEERWKVFEIDTEEKLPTLHLHSFNDDQIQKFLQTHDPDPETRWHQIQEIPGLKDVASRPVLLQIIIDHLEAVLRKKKTEKINRIKATDLYEEAILAEIDRKANELPELKIETAARLEILEKLSAWMYSNDTLLFDVPLLEEELKLKEYFGTKRDWEYQKYLNEFLTFSFQLNEGHERFRISHKSFRDYLAARNFVKEIKSEKVIYFGQKKTTEELNSFIREIDPSDSFKSRLLDVIQASKNVSEQTKWQGTNAANVLIRLDPDALKGKNLAEVNLPEVDLIYANLSGTKLTSANLSQARCNRSFLAANFEILEIKGGELYSFFREVDSWEKAEDLRKRNFRSELSNIQIESIEKLKKLQGLVKLDFEEVKVFDVTLLAYLPNLSILNLRSTQVSDVSILKGLTNLTDLDLSSTQVSVVSVLKGLINLTNLYLRSTHVSDVSPLKGLKNLRILDLSLTQVSDVSSLKGLTNLRILDLNSTLVSDISVLKGFTNLTLLNLKTTQVSDVSSLMGLTNLTTLDLSSPGVSDVSVLKGLTNLIHLYLSSTQVSDISALKGLTNLTHLSLSSTQVSDISALIGLPNLTWLSLSSMHVSDISVLKGLTNLTYLDLRSTQVSDVSVLKELPNLTHLDLRSTQVSDVSVLKGLTNLTHLYLCLTQVSDISALKGLTNLTHLSLSSTHVSDISVLKELTNLTILDLRSTMVSDVAVLYGFKKLNKVELNITLLEEIQITTLVHALSNCEIVLEGF